MSLLHLHVSVTPHQRPFLEASNTLSQHTHPSQPCGLFTLFGLILAFLQLMFPSPFMGKSPWAPHQGEWEGRHRITLPYQQPNFYSSRRKFSSTSWLSILSFQRLLSLYSFHKSNIFNKQCWFIKYFPEWHQSFGSWDMLQTSILRF